MADGRPQGANLWAPVQVEEGAVLSGLLPDSPDLGGMHECWASMAMPAARGTRGVECGRAGARVVCGPLTTAVDVDDVTLAGPREVAATTGRDVWLVHLLDAPQPLLGGHARAGPAAQPRWPGKRATPGRPRPRPTPRATAGGVRQLRWQRPRPARRAKRSGRGSAGVVRGDASDAVSDGDHTPDETSEEETDGDGGEAGSTTEEETGSDDEAPVTVRAGGLRTRAPDPGRGARRRTGGRTRAARARAARPRVRRRQHCHGW